MLRPSQVWSRERRWFPGTDILESPTSQASQETRDRLWWRVGAISWLIHAATEQAAWEGALRGRLRRAALVGSHAPWSSGGAQASAWSTWTWEERGDEGGRRRTREEGRGHSVRDTCLAPLTVAPPPACMSSPNQQGAYVIRLHSRRPMWKSADWLLAPVPSRNGLGLFGCLEADPQHRTRSPFRQQHFGRLPPLHRRSTTAKRSLLNWLALPAYSARRAACSVPRTARHTIANDSRRRVHPWFFALRSRTALIS